MNHKDTRALSHAEVFHVYLPISDTVHCPISDTVHCPIHLIVGLIVSSFRPSAGSVDCLSYWSSSASVI